MVLVLNFVIFFLFVNNNKTTLWYLNFHEIYYLGVNAMIVNWISILVIVYCDNSYNYCYIYLIKMSMTYKLIIITYNIYNISKI